MVDTTLQQLKGVCTIRLILPNESKDEQLLRVKRVSDLEVSLEESSQCLWEQE